MAAVWNTSRQCPLLAPWVRGPQMVWECVCVCVCVCVCGQNELELCTTLAYPLIGKIQRDGRKFLDRWKLFWITNIITIIKWDPYLPITAKIRNKRWVFSYIFLSLIVSSSRRMLSFDVWPSFPVTTWTLPYISADFGKTIILTTQRSQIAFFPVHFRWFFNCLSLFNEAAYLAALCRLRSQFAISDANSKQSRTKISDFFSSSLFVADFGCNW